MKKAEDLIDNSEQITCRAYLRDCTMVSSVIASIAVLLIAMCIYINLATRVGLTNLILPIKLITLWTCVIAYNNEKNARIVFTNEKIYIQIAQRFSVVAVPYKNILKYRVGSNTRSPNTLRLVLKDGTKIKSDTFYPCTLKMLMKNLADPYIDTSVDGIVNSKGKMYYGSTGNWVVGFLFGNFFIMLIPTSILVFLAVFFIVLHL